MKIFWKIAGVGLLVIIVAAGIFIWYAWYRLHNIKDHGDLRASMDKASKKFMQANGTRAMVLGIYKDGESASFGYGTTGAGTQALPDSTSVFELASVSKLFTTSLLQLMADRGTISIDDRIAVLLKDQVTLPAGASATTLRHLATHTSGFPPLPASFLAKMTDEQDPYKALSVQDLYDYLKQCKDKKPEGEPEYSNFGMGLLGHILALKSGQTYEEAVSKLLLQPLQMHHTFVTIDSGNKEKIVQGYNEAGQPNPVWTDHVLTGAGSFLSNTADMLRFIRANLDPANPLYASLAKTREEQFGKGTGLGWVLPQDIDRFMGNQNMLWHNGMAGGYASFIAIDPVSKSGVVVLANKAVDVTTLGMKLMRMVNTQSWGK